VVVDFPDPTNYSLGKLYTTAFYRLLAKHLSAQGLAVVQSTSPLFARQSYWCIVETGRSLPIRVAGAPARRIALPLGRARAPDVSVSRRHAAR
jgi:predicted membrane-bound spermidine synthase